METEVKKPEVEPPPVEAKETAPAPAAPPEDSQEQINWRRFREAREKERKEKIEAEKRAAEKDKEVAALKAAMDALVNKPAQGVAEETSEETEDQRIQRKVEESLRRERQKMEEQHAQQEQATFPQRLAENYKDFDKVCTEENLDYLEYHYPEVAFPYKHLPDSYSKWEKIYQAVKRFVPNVDSKKENAKAEKNLTKPQSMSIHGKTQTGDSAPQMLDDKRKADNWARMQKTMRGG